MNKRALLNKGDFARIQAVMQKAMQGENLTIGVIGGSITAGANASDFGKTAWAPLVRDWWVKKFPKASFKYVNAGIGATNSLYGVYRAERDLLCHKPDFVIVEFSVNDNGLDVAGECYESLIKKILLSDKMPGVMALATMEQNMINWQEYHLPVCKHYGIPYLSYRDVFTPDVRNGNIKWSDLSRDDVHPNDYGHSVAAELITDYLELILEDMKIPEPLYANGYSDGIIFNNSNLEPVSYGSWEKYEGGGYFQGGWISKSKGEPIVFEFNAGYITIEYMRMTTPNLAAKAYAVVDGKDRYDFNADFTGGWGDCITQIKFMKENSPKKHRIEVFFDDENGKESVINRFLVSNFAK